MSDNPGGVNDSPGESETIDLRIEDDHWIDEVLRQGELAAVDVIRRRDEHPSPKIVSHVDALDPEVASSRETAAPVEPRWRTQPTVVTAPITTRRVRPAMVDPDLAAIAARTRLIARDAKTRRRQRLVRRAVRLAVVAVAIVVLVLLAIAIVRRWV